MNRSSKEVVPAAVVLVALLSAPWSVAQATDPAVLAAEGVRLRREGKDQEALPLFQEALKLQPTPRAFAQVGVCEQAVGLWVAAEEHMIEALKHSEDLWIKKNEAALREALAFVQGKIGSMTIWGTPAGAKVSIDGEPAGRLPLPRPVRVAAGRRVLVTEAPDFITDTRAVEVQPGNLSREHVALVAVPLFRTPSSDQLTTSPPAVPILGHDKTPKVAGDTVVPAWRRVLPWVLVGGAALSTSLAVWQHAETNRSLDAFEVAADKSCATSLPNRGGGVCQGLYDTYASHRRRAIVGYGVGSALGLGAAVMLIINWKAAGNSVPAEVALARGTAVVSYSLFF